MCYNRGMARDKILIDYVTKNDRKEEIFHSSGMAQARSGAGMGAASTESFSARRALDQNRQIVKGYSDSKIMRGNIYKGVRAKTYNPNASEGVLGESVQNLRSTQGSARATGTANGATTGATGADSGGVTSARADGPRPMRQAPPMRRGF